MPICFWNLCHCPDAQPCTEHTGTGCSIVNGTAVTDEKQIDDAVTRGGEAAIAKTESDKQRVEQIVRDLEARKAQLERERSELERQANDADSRDERRAVVEQQRVLMRRHQNLEAEVRALAAEIDGLGAPAAALVAPLSAALKRPYTDAAGYCACYTEKLARLTALDGQITTETTNLGTVTASYNAARTVVLPKLRITFTLAFVIFLMAFIWLSVGAALVVGAFLALLFTAASVVGLAAQLGTRRSAVFQSRAALYTLWLSYYRVQQIPTCIRDVDVDDDEHEENGDNRRPVQQQHRHG